MKILFFDAKKYEVDYFLQKSSLKNNIFLFKEEPLLNSAQIKDNYVDVEILSIFTSSRLSADILSKFKNLKLITTRSVGYSHIDIEYCKKNNIFIANTPHYGDNTVSEFAFALLLNLIRKITRVTNSFKHCECKPNYTGIELYRKTIGIIGVGAIGSKSVRIAHGFGMNILCNDILENKDLIDKYNVTYTDIKTLCAKSDFIFLHAPLTMENYHLLNNEIFNIINKNAIIVNTARGELIDTKALYNALVNNKIKGAALDVIECEEFFNPIFDYFDEFVENCSEYIRKTLLNHLLSNFENVIITPHIAYDTQDAILRILTITEQTLKEYINKEKMTYLLNLHK